MSRRWNDLCGGLAALKRSGLLGPRPAGSLWQLLLTVTEHGVSLYTVAAWNARRWPERVALHDDGGPVSFAALLELADRMAGELARHPAAGGGVGLLCRNRAPFVAALLACGRLGRVAAPLDPAFTPEQLRGAAGAFGLLVCDDDLAAGLDGEGLPVLTLSALQAAPPCTLLRRRGRGGLVLHTSGTTGRPQPVPRRANLPALLSTLKALLERLPLRSGAPTLLTLPLFHGHGFSALALSLTLGAPLHLSARARPGDHWKRLREEHIEVVVLVPTVLYRLLHSPSARPVPALRAIICGSAPLGAALAVHARQTFGPVLHNLYGTSETGLISHAAPDDLRCSPDTVGSPLPGVKLELRVGERLAGTGEVGRVTVRGALAVAGAPGFHDTGDLGRLDAAGRLTLHGRRDDLLLIGGENVWPESIEARTCSLPQVRDCAVAGQPCPEYGQALQAWVVLAQASTPGTLAQLEHDLAGLLPRRLRPVQLQVVTALPRNALGKLLRSQLGREGEPQLLSGTPERHSSG